MDKHGYFTDNHQQANVEQAFRDYEGNTLFTACGVSRSFRVGGAIASVIFLPTFYVPYFEALIGFNKYHTNDILLIKQDSTGKLSLATTIAAPKSEKGFSASAVSDYDPNNYFKLDNSATHIQYLVIRNQKETDIYNVNQHKIARTIARKSGGNWVSILPAKEGSIAVSEYNTKDRSSRMSIEPL